MGGVGLSRETSETVHWNTEGDTETDDDGVG